MVDARATDSILSLALAVLPQAGYIVEFGAAEVQLVILLMAATPTRPT